MLLLKYFICDNRNITKLCLMNVRVCTKLSLHQNDIELSKIKYTIQAHATVINIKDWY